MKELKISKEISFPKDVVTQTLAMIGRKGAGKTYLATMVAEQMLDIKAQVVVIDPVGNWWGLRIGADGKSKGKEIFVIGGDHGDVPLVPEAGAKIAQLLVEKGVSAVIDVSSFRIGEHKRFAADFAEEFFHLKKSKRSPVHVFIEEAQKIIPQRVGPDEARMVGAFEQIVRLGRNYGIGCSLVTQRPQSVNKEVLSQVECLCVLQVTGPHERKALEEWVQEVGADRSLIGELPGLAQGEGYVWSPSWLRIYKRVHFAKKQTFDASATPEVGKTTRAANISAVDVEQLKSDMADVVAQAEKDDPKALRRKIIELERRKPETSNSSKQIAEAVKETERRKDREFDIERQEWLRQIDNWFKILKSIGEAAGKALKDYKPYDKKFTKVMKVQAVAPEKWPIKPTFKPSPQREEDQDSSTVALSGPEQRILDAVAWFENIAIGEPDQVAVAFLAGYTYGGGAFNNPRGSLRTRGLVEYQGDKIKLTDNGRALANFPDKILTSEELHQAVLSRLPGPEQKLLRVLLEVYPDDISFEELAHRTEYQFGGGAFNNPKGRLRSLGLVEYPASGRIRARDLLFI